MGQLTTKKRFTGNDWMVDGVRVGLVTFPYRYPGGTCVHCHKELGFTYRDKTPITAHYRGNPDCWDGLQEWCKKHRHELPDQYWYSCRICMIRFYSPSATTRYCLHCSSKAQQFERARIRGEYQCQHCGQSFTPKRSTAKFCSAKCRVYASRAK